MRRWLIDCRSWRWSDSLDGLIRDPAYDPSGAGSVQTIRCGEGDVVHGFGLPSAGTEPVRLACTRPQLFLSLLTGAVINCAPILQLPAIEFGERSFWVIDTSDTTTVTFGAPGSQGVVFNKCPAGQSVVGIRSFSGEIWDNVALMCSQRYPIAIPG